MSGEQIRLISPIFPRSENGGEMKSNRASKVAKTQQGLLLNVARSIGSTLGTIAAKTGGVSKNSNRHAIAKKTRSKAAKTRKKRAA